MALDGLTALANTGSGTDVLAGRSVGGKFVGAAMLTDNAGNEITAENPLPFAAKGVPVPYWPGYSGSAETGPRDLGIDDDGALSTRSAVLTDEGTFRANFANTSYALDIGSVTVSGAVVAGSGFFAADVHYKDYFKLSADADTAWVQIATIDSDTQITLVSAYVGGSSGTGQRSILFPMIGSGGSITVGSGQATLASGTTNNAVTGLKRLTDYAPLVFRSRCSISQRIANQTTHIGLEEDAVTPRWFARFTATGTTNTLVTCETGRNPSDGPSASETETTSVTIPNAGTTAALQDYRVELLTESVRFYIAGILVAEHVRVIPHQHDEMTSHVEIRNGTGAASTTSVVIDYVTGKNHNKLEIGVMSDSEKIVAAQPPMATYSYSVAGVITINTDLIVIDCSQLRSLSIQCTSMGTAGVVTPAWSNDGTTFPASATLMTPAGVTAATFNAAGLWTTLVFARYLRLRLTTATTAGTTTIVVNGMQFPVGQPVAQPIAGTVTATVGTSITGGTISPLTVSGATIEPSTAKTASGNSATATNASARGAIFFVNVTAASGTLPTLAVKLQVQDPLSLTWVDVSGATTASITTTGISSITVFPGIAEAANSKVSFPLPRTYRLAWTIGGTTPSFTFSLAAAYII